MAAKKSTAKKKREEIPSIEFGRVTIDSPLRMLFTSTRDPSSIHLVDLEEQRGSGVCTCESYQFTIGPGIASGRLKLNTPAAWCKHIQAARQILATKTIQQLTEYVTGNRKPRKVEEGEN